MAGAVTGTSALGAQFAGASGIKLHSYKVADDDASCSLSHGAIISAFERGIALGDATLSCSFAVRDGNYHCYSQADSNHRSRGDGAPAA